MSMQGASVSCNCSTTDSNDVLKEKFRKLHNHMVKLNLSSAADQLFADGILTADEMRQLMDSEPDGHSRRLLVILHNSCHSEAFSRLYTVLTRQTSHRTQLTQLFQTLDQQRKYQQLATPPIPPRRRLSTLASSSPVLAPKLLEASNDLIKTAEDVTCNMFNTTATVAADRKLLAASAIPPATDVPAGDYEQLLPMTTHPEQNYTRLQVVDAAVKSPCSWTKLTSLAYGRCIRAVAHLSRRLYVCRRLSANIELYDSDNFQPISAPEGLLHIDHLRNPTDMAACTLSNCLYIVDPLRDNSKVFRVEPSPAAAASATSCWLVGQTALSLSVSSLATLVVTCHMVGQLREFSGSGQLLRQIILHTAVVNPTHAILLGHSNQFVVSYHTADLSLSATDSISLSDADSSASVHGVCIVTDTSHCPPIANYTSTNAHPLSCPRHIAVTAGGLILVADQNNSCVAVLDRQSLYRLDDIKLKSQQSQFHPMRLCHESRDHKLYVVYNESTNGSSVYMSGCVGVFRLRRNSEYVS